MTTYYDPPGSLYSDWYSRSYRQWEVYAETTDRAKVYTREQEYCTCSYCRSKNKGDASVCERCGAPMGE